MFETELKRYYAKFNISSDHIRHVLVETAEKNSIKLDQQALKGHKNTILGRVGGYRYELEISPEDEYFEVEERILVPLRWHLLLIIPSLTIALAALNLRFQVLTAHPSAQVQLTVLSGLFVLLWSSTGLERGSLLAQSSSENRDRITEYSAVEVSIILIGLSLSLFGILTLIEAGRYLTLSTLMIYLGLITVHLASVLSGMLISGRFFSINFVDRLPIFSLKLFLVEFMLIVGGASLLSGLRLIQANYRLIPGPIWVFSNLTMLVLGVLIFAGVVFYARDIGIPSYQDFLELQGVEIDLRIKIGVSVFLIIGSYLVLFLGYLMIQFVLGNNGFPLLRLSGLFIFAAVLYFPVGVVYQTARFLLEIKKIFDRSSPVKIDFDSEYKIRKTHFRDSDSRIYFAATVSTGINEFIFLSEDLIEDLGENELRAVVAHEASHIHNNESRIVPLVVFASLLTFVGRNLYYGLFDFRGREFRADREAADEVSPEPLICALKSFKENHTNASITGVGIAPFGGELTEPEGIDRYFDLFFGDYAIREAHPAIQERIKRLQKFTDSSHPK